MLSIRSAAALSAAATAAWVSLARLGRGDARVLQRRQLRLEPLQLLFGLGQLVGEGERRHHGEPRVADLAEARRAAREMRWSRSSARRIRCCSSPSSQAMRNWRPLMVTLDLRHGFPCRLTTSRRLAGDEVTERMRVDGDVEPLRDLAIGVSSARAERPRNVELGGEPRAVGRRAHATGRRARRRRDRPRAGARPPPPARRARAQAVWWRRRWRLARSFANPSVRPIRPGFVSLWPRESVVPASG